MNLNISWNSFAIYNQDERGIRFKFEDLCRQIFSNENLSSNQKFRYLHSSPNNAGLESEPIYDEKNKRWIGFQAKYFETKIDYNQILDSAEKIVTYYVGKIDHIFLFCNKPISTQSKTFQKIADTLSQANIEIELVTDTAILDLARKYPKLVLYYFGNHTINQEWIEEHNQRIFSSLGVRYNQKFNVDTATSERLSLFLIDQDAVKYINNKKALLIEKVQNLYDECYKYHGYLRLLQESIAQIQDIDEKNIFDAIDWQRKVESDMSTPRKQIEEELQELKTFLEAQSENNAQNEGKISEQYLTRNKIQNLNMLLELPSIIEVSTEEQNLLKTRVLLINGEAGIGKSQLLADKTHKLMAIHRKALLLLANQYLSEENIQSQIMQGLSLDYSFEDLIDILEVAGQSDGRIIPIFIDALNETWIQKTWEIGLPKIIDKIQKSSVVKLVLTYRPEYEQTLGLSSERINQDVKMGKILRISHTGFRYNSILAINQFFKHFNIPFTALNFFEYQLSNPLFLILYCKTYNEEEVDIPKLYERLIEIANENIYKTLASIPANRLYRKNENIIAPLIDEISNVLAEKNNRYISKEEFCNLNYWRNYGFFPEVFKNLLADEQIIYTSYSQISTKDTEYFYFAYDQMNDFYCAKAILKKYSDKNALRNFLSKKILGIQSGKLKNPSNIDLFINVCALYADKYNEECIDIIDSLSGEYKENIFNRYISSFQWRNRNSIPVEQFKNLLLKYPCEFEIIWEMFICNSVKVAHPLNADYLHDLLINLELNKRDFIWTIIINDLTYEKSHRLVQLVDMYNKGETLKIDNQNQIRLLLVLLAWILTSSNRQLRDCTSKAMIEILKNNFPLCQEILQKFENVNDPYVIQRLYGIVFGACCKRKNNSKDIFQELVNYVYHTIFNNEKVYPDILLRDYARLIIERYLFEFPNDNDIIDHRKIVPPYNSEPIPNIKAPDYSNIQLGSGIYRIINSMAFEGISERLYGDFGRYVFQSALRNFKVDQKKIFDYAIYYILNDLGYSEKFFGNIDRNFITYSRHQQIKIERIGKKYQWIAMYHILARVTDHYKMYDNYNFQSKEDDIFYEGAWNPYVRDFDPTLNNNFMQCADAPYFKVLNTFIDKAQKEIKSTDISTTAQQKTWLESHSIYFDNLKDTLILTDQNDIQWVSLTKYCDTDKNNFNDNTLIIWSWLYAYFVTPEQEKILKHGFDSGYSLINNDIATYHETYILYNREYSWSPNCKDFEKYAWIDVSVDTGEIETITTTIPDFSNFFQTIKDNNSTKISLKIEYKQIQHEHKIEKSIGKILHATTHLVWEEEYDASKNTTISYEVPCAKLIEDLHLRQMEIDGVYYDENGKLAAFDTNINKQKSGVVIRKDLLDLFLKKNNLKLVWFIKIGKEIHKENDKNSYSDWEAFFSYYQNDIHGKIRKNQEIAL